jgi:glycosyltransferase involved in cell wall biosynthesis
MVVAKYGKSCEIIPNGVDLPELPSQTDRVLALGLEPGRYVLTVGRLVPEKRQLDLLRAFAEAKPPGWKLAIVGRIDHENEYAERLASEADATENVVMAGFRSGEDLRQLYAHAGLFVLSSSHEGLPIALLEALSYGLPVLVSDIPANLEVIDDSARAFRMGDLQDLSTKISACTASRSPPADRETFRRESTRAYDWELIALRTSDAYAELMRARRGRRIDAAPGPATRALHAPD